MNARYAAWIEENVGENPMGQCNQITQEMAEEFPELKRVRGHYFCAFQGERAHWWLVTPSGEIVDPTKAQFPDAHGEYTPLVEGAKEPTGKCPNCGGLCYAGGTCCSDTCHREYAAFVTGSVR